MADQDVDNLKKYGPEFQTKCISSILSDKAFIERIFDILHTDYFESDSNKWIVEQIMSYFIQYKELPTLNVFKVKIDGIDNEVLKKSTIEQLRSVYAKLTDSDIKFVKEQFLEFCRNQKLKCAIIQSVDYLKLGQYDSIKCVVDDALKAGMERNLGHNYKEDIDVRMSSTARDCVLTNWPIIDTLMDGGLARGELGFIVGPTGSGKSWLLARLGAEAMKQGKNVIHFTLELNENYVGLRYDCCFTGIDFQDIRNHIDTVRQKIDKKFVPGQLFIKNYPSKSVSPHILKLYVERLQMISSVKIDLIVVDYADLLKPLNAERNSNSYSEAGSVYEELRTVAGELQVPIWSASQAHRAAHEEDVIQAHNVADSYRKIMVGDFVLSLSRKMEDKAAQTARIHVIKNRFGQDGLTFPTLFNSSNGDVRVHDPSSKEGMELQRKMGDSGDAVKDIIGGHWKKIKQRNNNGTDNDSD